MRQVVLEAARSAGIPVSVADVPPSSVAGASEVFLTNALTGIRPVRRLGTHVWTVGPITRLLRARLVEAGVAECAG
jgi:branched-subunit amino acid aminotransferase/4-amino-4-deoxychorismate lyase